MVPGDTLVMEMELTAFKPRFGLVKMKGAPQPEQSPLLLLGLFFFMCVSDSCSRARATAGVCYVDGQKVVEGDFQFAMVK